MLRCQNLQIYRRISLCAGRVLWKLPGRVQCDLHPSWNWVKIQSNAEGQNCIQSLYRRETWAWGGNTCWKPDHQTLSHTHSHIAAIYFCQSTYWHVPSSASIRHWFRKDRYDIIGPFSKSATGHKYILIVMDDTTRYPWVVPFWKASSWNIVREILMLFSRVRILKELDLMVDLFRLLQDKHLRTLVYHAQTDALVERMSQTLKQMLWRVLDEEGWN